MKRVRELNVTAGSHCAAQCGVLLSEKSKHSPQTQLDYGLLQHYYIDILFFFHSPRLLRPREPKAITMQRLLALYLCVTLLDYTQLAIDVARRSNQTY